MALNDPIANLMSKLLMSEQSGKQEVTVTPVSKLMKNILKIMNDHKYVGKHTSIKDNQGETITIPLLNRINKCGVIKPRFSVKKSDFEKFEKRYLPAKDFGLIIVSTPKGIMTHSEAKEQSTGGKLIAYIY